MQGGIVMTTQNVEAKPRPVSGHTARYLVSAAVVAALTGNALPQRAFAQEAAKADPLVEVTITGSRIVRNRDLEAPSPIVTLDKSLFEKSSSTGLESVLNQQPQFVPQATQFTSGVQGSPTFTPGAVTLNLR